ncbi:hypothetical protein [Asanoa iriomotensis]|uniref:HNH endonuclease n=1 Tax=Asanoa iriomotensis TaxID=234613 RepID=A0ABQ4CBT7_9ACTN|nr:hypothetical protein [Asanoa iriomotensis]GIF60223.1 hypothetical protein Air01nite_63180 [Asanoa iriomotensis]
MTKPVPVEIDQRFGALVVLALRPGPKQPNGKASGRIALVRCDACGQESTAPARKLVKGEHSTCGKCSGRANRHRSGIPGYVGAHHAVERAKGKASEHHCTVCLGQATEWALDIATPHELYAEPSGQNAGLAYSTNPDAYVSICSACHRRVDHSVPRSVRATIRELLTEDSRHTRGPASMTTPEPRPALPDVVTTFDAYESEAEARWIAGICVWCGQPGVEGSYSARFCAVDCGHESHRGLPQPPESFTRSRCAWAAQRLRQRLQRAARSSAADHTLTV